MAFQVHLKCTSTHVHLKHTLGSRVNPPSVLNASKPADGIVIFKTIINPISDTSFGLQTERWVYVSNESVLPCSMPQIPRDKIRDGLHGEKLVTVIEQLYIAETKWDVSHNTPTFKGSPERCY